MATITKREIAERIAKRTDQTQVVTKQVVQLFLEEIVDELARGNKLEFRDFGIFEVVTRRSRNGRNPRTGAGVFVPAKRVVSFKMGRHMKKVVAEDEAAARSVAADAPARPASASMSSHATSSSTDGPSGTSTLGSNAASPPEALGSSEPTDPGEGPDQS